MPAPPPPGLEARVVERLRTSGAFVSRFGGTRALAVAAAAAAVLFFTGFGLGRVVPPPSASAPPGPRYLLLLYGAPAATPDSEAVRVAEYAAWARDEAAAGRLESGEKLGDDAIVLGLSPSTREPALAPAGYFVIRASSIADAQVTAGRCPHLRHGGTVVVRPIVETR